MKRLKTEDAQKIAHRVMDLAGTLPVRVLVRSKKGLLVRFANNGVHQDGYQELLSYTVYLYGKEHWACLESYDSSKEGIQNALRKLRSFIPDSILPPTVSQLQYPKIREHFPFALKSAPEMAACAIKEGLDQIRQEQASANGYYSVYERSFYLGDREGLHLAHPSTAVRFGVTVTKGGGKGYHSFYHPNFKQLNARHVVNEAIHLAAQASVREVSVEPGEYECIFSPRALLELLEPLRPHFNLDLYEKNRSVLSGFLGQQICSEAFTLYEDVTHGGQFGVPFDVEGKPKKKVTLIDRGILKELLQEGSNYRGIFEHAIYPQNLVVQEGTLSLEALLKRIRRGIFINKIRYHALVREQGMEVTGLATAGSLYVEDGAVKGRINHLRYYDSLFSILRSVVGSTKEQLLLKDGEWGAALLPYLWISKLHVV